MARGDITVRLIGDIRDIERKFESVATKAGKIGDKMASVGKKLTTYVTLPLIAVGVGAFKAASDLNESMNKVDVVFGKAAGAVKAFAQDTATSMGLSRQEAAEAAATFGNLFTSIGIGQTAAAGMSTKLVRLAGDLASFNNTSPEDALEALRSGITGEFEPLKRYGVAINETTLKNKALELGLISNTGAAKKARAATDAIASAQRAYGDAVRNAAERTQNASRAVRDADRAVNEAEKSLTSAQRDAKTAQDALTDARKAAKQALEDLSLRVEENAVAEARGALRVKDAQEALQKARESGDTRAVTDAELELQDAQLSLTETTRNAQRDQEELNRRRKAGVAGSDEMRAAQEKVAGANESVKNAQQGLADAEERASDARKEQAKTAQENARSIADAQAAIAKAQQKTSDAISTTSDVLAPAIKAQAAYALIMEQTKSAQGDFARTADGAANKQRILKAELKDTAAAIGAKLLPLGQRLLDFGQQLIDKWSALSPHTQETIIKIAGVAAVIGPLVFGLGKLIKVFLSVGRVFLFISRLFLANPWLLLIAAVVLVTILIIRNWTKIKNFLVAVWNGIKAAASTVFNWLKNLFLNFTPYGQIIKHWKDIVAFFSTVWSGLKTGFKAAWDFIVKLFKGYVNFFIDAWNAIDFGIKIKVPKWVPGVGGKGFEIKDLFPDIPRLAMGGVVNSPTLAMIGEKGPEAVVPLGRRGAGPTTVNYTIEQHLAAGVNPAEVGRAAVEAIKAYEKRNGSGWRAA